VPYAIYASPSLAATDWRAVGLATWSGLAYSAMFSVCLAYMIWYVAIRQIGGTRTSVYSNVIPIVAMAAAYVWLDEPVGWVKVVGASAVLGGVAITRLERLPFLVPAEE